MFINLELFKYDSLKSLPFVGKDSVNVVRAICVPPKPIPVNALIRIKAYIINNLINN